MAKKRLTKKIQAAAILIAVILTALFILIPETKTPKTENTPERPELKNETEEKAGELPEKLSIEMPRDIPAPNNPCYLLEVPEQVKEKTGNFSEHIEKAQTRKENILGKHKPPLEIYRGTTEGKKVALTIDTGIGGSEGVEELLQIAEHYGIELTFFFTGCWVLENPHLTQKIFAQGHSIGNHSLTHSNIARISDGAAEKEIKETGRIIKETLGIEPFLFRKPQYGGGERGVNIAGQLGYISVQGWPDLGDTTGWRSETTAEDVLALVSGKTEPGSIWVFHNLSEADLGAFEDIVRFHLEEGYELVRAEEVLQ